MSFSGLESIFALILLGSISIGVVYMLLQILRKNYNKKVFLLMVIILENIIFFMVVNTSYGETIFECRYLLIVLFSMVLMALVAFEQLKEKSIIKATSIMLLLLFGFICLDVAGDRYFIKKSDSQEDLEQIIHYVDQLNSPVVYVCADNVTRNLRVLDGTKVYRRVISVNEETFWGEYTYYSENADYNGPNYMVTVNYNHSMIPDWLFNTYTQVAEIGDYQILYSDVNKFDFTSKMGAHTIDFPYSCGYAITGNVEEDGVMVTDGTEGYCLLGPEQPTQEGIYNITLSYDVLQENTEGSFFEMTIDNGNTVVAREELDANSKNVTLQNVEIPEGTTFSYKIYNASGTILQVEKIEVIRQ